MSFTERAVVSSSVRAISMRIRPIKDCGDSPATGSCAGIPVCYAGRVSFGVEAEDGWSSIVAGIDLSNFQVAAAGKLMRIPT